MFRLSQEHAVILVVEDETLIRMDISDQLQDCGFRVLQAKSAAEAIDVLRACADVQILFTDVDMPGNMDGLQLSAAVRDKWPQIKIMVTSGHRNVRLADIPSDSRFFTKPYLASVIADAARGMLEA